METIVTFHDELIGLLVREHELVALGGELLADAFYDPYHHVQLAREPSGRYAIIDDTNSDAYVFIDGVVIEETPSARGRVGAAWKFSQHQSDEARKALCEFSELERVLKKHGVQLQLFALRRIETSACRPKRRRNIGVAGVLAELRRGASLRLSHSPHRHWHLSSGEFVRAEIAHAVIARSDVAGVGDALFDDVPSQTWRYVDEEHAND